MTGKTDWSKVLSKHCYKILEQIFMEKPPDILWHEILGLFEELKKIEIDGLKGVVNAPPGGNVRVRLDHRIGVFAEPDPKLPTASYNIGRVREFLILVGVIPSSHSKSFFPWRLKK